MRSAYNQPLYLQILHIHHHSLIINIRCIIIKLNLRSLLSRLHLLRMLISNNIALTRKHTGFIIVAQFASYFHPITWKFYLVVNFFSMFFVYENVSSQTRTQVLILHPLQLWYVLYPDEGPWYELLVIPLRFELLCSIMIPISIKVSLHNVVIILEHPYYCCFDGLASISLMPHECWKNHGPVEQLRTSWACSLPCKRMDEILEGEKLKKNKLIFLLLSARSWRFLYYPMYEL